MLVKFSAKGFFVAGFAIGLLSVFAADGSQLALGANVNESLTQLNATLIKRSHTTWVRGFIPASEFIKGDRSLASDPGIQALQSCARSGCKLIVSIKWDLQKAGWRVPPPSSDTEKKWFAWVDALTDRLNGQISILSLVNELFIDTIPEDLKPQADGQVPIIVFLQRLANHVAARKIKAASGAPLPIYCGGLTRLDKAAMQTNPVVLNLIRWCNNSLQIAGIDFHLHEANYNQFNQALDFLRQHLKSKPIIVTEYSMIWNYKPHLAEKIGAGDLGKDFCAKYNISSSLSVLDYINDCLADPVSQTEWNDFIRSRDWLDPHFINRTSSLMEQHGVVVATYAFSQTSSGGRHSMAAHAVPWLLNPIYVPCTARGESNTVAVNTDWFNEYLAHQHQPANINSAFQRRTIPSTRVASQNKHHQVEPALSETTHLDD